MFGLSSLSHQGAFFTSFTPLRIEDYLHLPFIPPRSAYHIVACYNPLLLARAHTSSVLTNYLSVSEKIAKNTIIDLCLPYFEQHTKRTYLARYIIFAGQLLAIRLSTNVRKLAPLFSSWPRHKKGTVPVETRAKKCNISVGQISIYLGNARVGLLFEEEMSTSAQQYLNCGFQIIALSYQGRHHQKSVFDWRQALARECLVLQGGDGEEWQAQIGAMLFGGESNESKKGRVFMAYYSLQKIYRRKQKLYLSETERTLITPIIINLNLLQQQIPILPIDDSQYQLVPTGYLLPNATINCTLNKYLQRLYIFYRRGECKKLVVVLQDSPQMYCFLHVLDVILGEMEHDSQPIAFPRIFKFVDLGNTRLSAMVHKFKMLRFEKVQQMQRSQSSKKQSKQENMIKLIRLFDFLSNSQARQNFFPVITADPQTVNLLRMLNQRQKVKLEFGEMGEKKTLAFDNSCECLSEPLFHHKTWIASSFFSEEEVKQLYFSKKMMDLVEDEEWHLKMWQTRWWSEREDSLGADTIDENSIAESLKLEDFLQKNYPLIHEFNEHYRRVAARSNHEQACNKSLIFSHFLFRKLTVVQIQSESSLLHQLLLTSQQNMFNTFCFLHNRPIPLQHRLSPKLALNSIAIALQENSRKKACHSCKAVLQPGLLLTCSHHLCKESFCYRCLEEKGFYTAERADSEEWEKKGINLCPICRGSCSNCQPCEQKRSSLALNNPKQVNTNNSECHYCTKDSHLFQFGCSNCHRSFCLPCIKEFYSFKSNEYERSDWRCFVCMHRCYCNSCEAQKQKIMALEKEKEGQKHRKGILKGKKQKKLKLEEDTNTEQYFYSQQLSSNSQQLQEKGQNNMK